MDESNESNTDTLLNQLRRLLHDGIEYASSVLHLLQAQIAAMALSSVVFVLMLFFASMALIISFVLVSVAGGIWLTHQTGSSVCSLLIIGGTYLLIALILGGRALHWLKRLKS